MARHQFQRMRVRCRRCGYISACAYVVRRCDYSCWTWRISLSLLHHQRTGTMRIHLSKIFSSVWQTVFRQTLPVCSMSTRHHRCSHSPFLHHHLPPRHHLHPSSLFPRLSHTYTTDSSPLPKSNRCWRCERELDKDDGSRVNFFCPCDKHVVLPPSNTHNYFEIMDW